MPHGQADRRNFDPGVEVGNGPYSPALPSPTLRGKVISRKLSHPRIPLIGENKYNRVQASGLSRWLARLSMSGMGWSGSRRSWRLLAGWPVTEAAPSGVVSLGDIHLFDA